MPRSTSTRGSFRAPRRGTGAAFRRSNRRTTCMVLFTKVDTAADQRAAERDLAFRLARHRFAPQPRNLQDPARGRAAAALHERGRRLGADQQRHLAGPGRRARPDQGADRRGEAEGRGAGRRRRVRLYARARTMRSSSMPATIRPSASTTCTLSGGPALRAALVPEAPERAAARPAGAAPPVTEANCRVPRGADRTWPALNREGMFRTPARRRRVRRRGADLVRATRATAARRLARPTAGSHRAERRRSRCVGREVARRRRHLPRSSPTRSATPAPS